MKRFEFYLLLALAIILPVTMSLVQKKTVIKHEAVEVMTMGRQKMKMSMSLGINGGQARTRVVLKNENGQVVSGKKIIFTYDGGWNYGVPVLTDSQGVAEHVLPLTGDDNRTGFCSGADYQMNAYFQGDDQYLPVLGKLDFTKTGTLGVSEKEFESKVKEKRVEALPFTPWGDPDGDDGLAVPHGVLYYKTWRELGNYNFVNNRSEMVLPDGRGVEKPMIFGMLFFNEAGDQSNYAGGSYSTEGHCSWPTVPKYCDVGWQNAYLAKVEEMGRNLDGKIDGVMVSFGYDGEANFVKNDRECETYLNNTFDCGEGAFRSMLKKAIDKHVEVFPNTPVFVQGAPDNPDEAISGNWGYKLNNFTSSSGEWGYKSGWVSDYEAWIKYPEMMRAYESKQGGSGLYRSYWMILNMLNAKPDFIDFFKNKTDLGHWKVFEKVPWFSDLLFGTLGKEVFETDQVWSVLREVPDGAKKENSSYPCAISGYYGDFSSYLYRRENLDNNKTEAIDYTETMFRGTYRRLGENDFDYDQPFTNRSSAGPLPGGESDGYQPMTGLIAKTARKNATNNHLMSFDVDNGWEYAGLRPGGSLKYKVYVVYLDKGSDKFLLEYKNESDELKNKMVTKTDTSRWMRKELELTDAYFADQMEGMTDIRINDNNDGYEVIHMLQIEGEGEEGGPRPTSTISPSLSPSVNPSPTSSTRLGDANGDGEINRQDFFVWVGEFVNYKRGERRDDWLTDFNGDIKVTVLDFVIWRREALR